jgi:hypothetical protein
MKTRHLRASRPRLEELEGRLVPSVVASTSTNWSGYAVSTSRGAVTAVSGSWVVPAVTGSGTAYSSSWVGVDGFNSSTVEQIGTDSDLANGTPQYYAWYEMYPSGSLEVPVTIHAGDAISAAVTYGSGAFTLSLTDVTTGQSYQTTQTAPGAQRSSAEWIEEAPSSFFGVLPLANFGTVAFSKAQAAVGGTTGPIDAAWSNAQVNKINMVSRFGATEDTTSALGDSGTTATSSFTVTYAAAVSAPPPPRGHGHGFGRSSDQAGSSQTSTTTTSTVSASVAISALGASLLNTSAQPVPALSSLFAQPSAVAAPAGTVVSPTLPVSFRQSQLSGAGHSPDGWAVDQVAGPELLPPPSEAGSSGDRPTPPSSPDAIQSPADGMAHTPLLGATPTLARDACFIEGLWAPAAPSEDASSAMVGADDGAMGVGVAAVLLGFVGGGSWDVRGTDVESRRPRRVSGTA